MELPARKPVRPRRRKTRAVVAFLVGLVGTPALIYFSRATNPGWRGEARQAERSAPAVGEPQLDDGYSNIHATDYVGPEACGECHVKQYDRWRSHPHSRMNQDPDAHAVLGDFSARTATYGELQARFEQRGDAYFMTFHRVDGPARVRREFRVTRTGGSRFTQMYIGVQTEGPEPADDPIYRVERKLPYGFWITRDRWLPANYFDTDFLPDYDGDGHNGDAVDRLFRGNRWERNCIYCHNTYPYTSRLHSGLENLVGFPPDDLHLRYDGGALSRDELKRRRRLQPDTLVTLGISCESCHFGGRIHAQDKDVLPRFLPSAPDLIFPAAAAKVVQNARETPYVIGSICAQCHAAEGVSLYPDGSATWNSREAPDLFGSACASELTCTDCHDPHTPSPAGGSPDREAHVRVCTSCHDHYASETQRQAHSKHGDAASCLDCHMPRRVQGLDAVIRTHRISSPTDPAMLGQAAPNACNLCHLERSIDWTLEALSEHWSPVTLPEGFEVAYGDRTRAMAQVWAQHEVPITRLVLTDALARGSQRERALPMLVKLLDDPSPVNRMFALFAVEGVLERTLAAEEYEPTAPPARRGEQVRRLETRLR